MISTESISKLFNEFNNLTAIVIGDVMVDSYIWGSVNRMSPEAPVPIVEVEKRENRLGGAANVGLNLKALGAKPILCSVIGDDPKGNEFIELLKGEGMLLDGIIQSSSRITTTKFRVIGNNSQLLRVDEETTENLEEIYQEAIQNKVKEIIQVNDVDVIIFQDYDKGVINAELIEFVSKEAKEFDIPVVIDPKKENFMHYKDVTLFKPNLKEIKDGLNTDFDENNDADIEINVAKLQDELNADMVLNTLSEKGVFISWRIDGGYESMLIPAHVRNIADVSGAGDTVISVAALCVSQKLEPPIMAAISNLAGGLVCEEVGVVSLDKGKLLNEINNILIKT
ncbi:MAG: D-glycero-beta-D-manno-heptose-7-phosphate kinase [Lentimicrobiaceae bacterium]|nr:D-glycero-beta-D-manno-heptose-7-phosphate kinase [Lentimicrobiaceae bacterium]MDG1901510.1 bifunctional ADP-heptose synthase [Bacteroidales bacterium]MBT3175197.1 D-glycero-beta-D-manno-heptose-7-phosphate kinase [Lentimicrobiaceae bacterium]MBT3454370.1 D-glycero-beta-D-manno-heptose-7-phosphate kinase [Lentimicrobiaceae bacterium]MBT4060631.1 D-glycero-beta-D-manno-heptose-7-phosphate kinase [Lentimicrobiaceae bacterium]|tara:strand:+ start:3276 stop:4292 length:1017 start_codon:yes stop_codon:yes gene_type:complete